MTTAGARRVKLKVSGLKPYRDSLYQVKDPLEVQVGLRKTYISTVIGFLRGDVRTPEMDTRGFSWMSELSLPGLLPDWETMIIAFNCQLDTL